MLTISSPSTWRCWMRCFGCRFHVPWQRTASRWTGSWSLLCGWLWMCRWLRDSWDWGMQTGWWWWWWWQGMCTTMIAGLCTCWCLVWRDGHWLRGQTGWYFMRRCWCLAMARWRLLGMRASFSSDGDYKSRFVSLLSANTKKEEHKTWLLFQSSLLF